MSCAIQEGSRAQFNAWAAHNNKEYSSAEEAERRFAVWTANVQRQASKLAAADASGAAAEVSVNGLADVSLEEFKAGYLGQVSRRNVEALGCAYRPPVLCLLACFPRLCSNNERAGGGILLTSSPC